VNDVERLLALEEIKALKARYCRCMDAREWDGWRECFTDDVAFYFTSKPMIGVDALADFGAHYLGRVTSVHQVHNPEIDFQSETEATGIWALHDILIWPEPNNFGITKMVGYGNYHERYRRVDGSWRIAEVKITRFLVDKS
jgi:hypothetical protein